MMFLPWDLGPREPLPDSQNPLKRQMSAAMFGALQTMLPEMKGALVLHHEPPITIKVSDVKRYAKKFKHGRKYKSLERLMFEVYVKGSR